MTPTNKASIRRGTAEDFEGWLAVLETVAAEGKWIGTEVPVDRDDMRRRYLERLDEDNAATFVAEAPGAESRVVGTLGIHKMSFGVAEFGMSILDGWRGQGVGSGLLSAAIDWAREHEAHKITLQMWPHNTSAQALYEKFGFVVEGRLRRHYPRKNGELWDAVIMGLVLDETTPGSPYH